MRAGAWLGTRAEDRRRPLGVLVSAILVLVAVVLALTGGAEPESDLPRVVSAADLVEAEDARGQPIYWAGERPPLQAELTVEASGAAYVRYVDPDRTAPRGSLLTVATYGVEGAEAALRAAALASEVELAPVAGGGLVFVPPGPAQSVYLVFSGSEQQVEVYDPAPGRAWQLVREGAIRPVGG